MDTHDKSKSNKSMFFNSASPYAKYKVAAFCAICFAATNFASANFMDNYHAEFDSVQNNIVQTDTAQTDTSQIDTSQIDTAQGDTVQTDIVQNLSYSAVNPREVLIDSAVGKIISANQLNRVELYGTYRNKSVYAEDIRLEIKDIATNKTLLTIRPREGGGYKPALLLTSFKEGETEQIFLGMESGGSGGYGFFYVYDTKDAKQTTLFDSDTQKFNFTANYADCYKVEVQNADSGDIRLIDISGRPSDYLSKLYLPNGKLIKPVAAVVSSVNYVFPFYNSSKARFDLEVYLRITGLYNADALGYVVNKMTFGGGGFAPYFVTVEIFPSGVAPQKTTNALQ